MAFSGMAYNGLFCRKIGERGRGMAMFRLRRKYRNGPEQECMERLAERGFLPMKRGWPDFIAFAPDGRVIAVEVKPNDTIPLKRTQIKVMEILHAAGIRCERYDPINGFTTFEPAQAKAHRGQMHARRLRNASVVA